MRKIIAALLIMTIVVVVFPRLATAGAITFAAPTISVSQEPYDQTGYFDVTVYQTGGGSSLFQFEADLFLNPGASLVNLINADLNTSAPYVFNGNSGDQTNSVLPFLYNLPNSVEAENSDSPITNVGVALSSTPLGLMRIEYDVPANTALGTYALTFNQNLTNGDYVETTGIATANYFLPSVVNGAIVVAPAPEPSSVVMILLGAACLLGRCWRRFRRGT